MNRKMALAFLVLLVLSLLSGVTKLMTSHPSKSIDNPYVGRWRLMDDEGRLAAVLTVTSASACREHVPGESCKPMLVGAELRLEWSDGFRDVLRPTNGDYELAALPRFSNDWKSAPRFKLRAHKF